MDRVENSIEIRNFTATFALKPPLDLDAIYSKFDEKLNSKWGAAIYSYGGIVFWVHRPKMTFLIYKNGKIICLGAKNIIDVRNSPKYLINLLKKAGLNDIRLSADVEVRNVVATFRFDKVMDLGRISMIKGLKAIYEPEQFPACIIKIPVGTDSEATILLFSSGKGVCVGLKKVDKIYEAIKRLYSEISSI